MGSTKDIISVFYKQTDKDPVTEENFVLKLFLGWLKLSCAYKRKQIVSPDFNHSVKVTNYYFTYVEIKIICRLPLHFIPSNLRSGPGFFFFFLLFA